jgi:hypothetical protein
VALIRQLKSSTGFEQQRRCDDFLTAAYGQLLLQLKVLQSESGHLPAETVLSDTEKYARTCEDITMAGTKFEEVWRVSTPRPGEQIMLRKGRWANLPPVLLRALVLAGNDIVACASVSKAWYTTLSWARCDDANSLLRSWALLVPVQKDWTVLSKTPTKVLQHVQSMENIISLLGLAKPNQI